MRDIIPISNQMSMVPLIQVGNRYYVPHLLRLQSIVRQFLPADLLWYSRASALFRRLSSESLSRRSVAPTDNVTFNLLFS